jgi:hypothetical protein
MCDYFDYSCSRSARGAKTWLKPAFGPSWMARLACPHAPLRTLIGRSSRDAVLHTGDDNDEFTERPERLRTLLTERQ